MEDPVIAPSAYKHNITKDQMLHAYNLPIASHDVEDEMVMLIGGDSSGQLLEVGIVTASDGGPVIVHAMKARSKYLG